MEILAELTEEILGLGRHRAARYRIRRAARAVLQGHDGRIAIFRSGRWGYCKVPGGGIEQARQQSQHSGARSLRKQATTPLSGRA